MKAKEKAKFIADLALEKKGEDIVIMDVGKTSGLCDYFVIISAPSNTRMNAIADAIKRGLFEQGEKMGHREGLKDKMWCLVDSIDVVVHIFHTDSREFYDLDNLWVDAPKKKVKG